MKQLKGKKPGQNTGGSGEREETMWEKGEDESEEEEEEERPWLRDKKCVTPFPCRSPSQAGIADIPWCHFYESRP